MMTHQLTTEEAREALRAYADPVKAVHDFVKRGEMELGQFRFVIVLALELEEERRLQEQREADKRLHGLCDAMHRKICRYNHSDQCGYEYEKWSAPGDSKKRELKRVKEMLEHTDLETLEKLVESL